MKLIYNKVFLEHDTGMHPENRKRLLSLGELEETELPDGEQYLETVHNKDYIRRVKQTCRDSMHLDADTITSPGSYRAACAAVAASVLASERGDFAVVRPPGHHAYPDHSSGFCIFNNIAIAVQRLVDSGKRVMILDFDGHLGDGTVRYFYESDKVLYWSLHQFPAFPGGGDVNEFGEGAGAGYTINVPLPPGSGDDIFWKAIDELMPVALQFKPDAVALSAGFDAHQFDLLLDLRLSLMSFHKLGRLLSDNFKNCFATLEGGYNIEMLPKCLYSFLDGYNRKEARYEEMETDSMIQTIEEFEARMYTIRSNLSQFWKL